MDILRSNSLTDGIRRIGFRKWYQRELLSSHAHMLLSLLSAVAMLASLEAFREASIDDKILDVLFVIVCGGIALWSLRRFLFLFMHAEDVANQASCGDCGEYGRFRVVAENCSHNETQVRCSKCQHLWTICG